MKSEGRLSKTVIVSLSIPFDVRDEAVKLAQSKRKSLSSLVTELLMRELQITNQSQTKQGEKNESSEN